MNAYVAVALFIVVAVSACVCVIKAYRKGLSDGLSVVQNNKIDMPVTAKKKDKADGAKFEEDKISTQLKNVVKF